MLVGILLIVSGILIAIHPPLLSMIVALFLISFGIILLMMRYYYRKFSRHFENPFMEFFVRF